MSANENGTGLNIKKSWIFLGLAALIAIYIMLFHNGMVSLKNQISAAARNNQQVYSSIRIQIEQSGLVANTYADQVVRAVTEAVRNRYGGGGIKGTMLWIQEQNPNIDPATFTKIQQIVETSYSRFEANQTTLLDKGRVFDTRIQQFPGSILAGVLGWSHADIEPFMTVLVSTEAQRDFSTGTMTAPKIFGGK